MGILKRCESAAGNVIENTKEDFRKCFICNIMVVRKSHMYRNKD